MMRLIRLLPLISKGASLYPRQTSLLLTFRSRCSSHNSRKSIPMPEYMLFVSRRLNLTFLLRPCCALQPYGLRRAALFGKICRASSLYNILRRLAVTNPATSRLTIGVVLIFGVLYIYAASIRPCRYTFFYLYHRKIKVIKTGRRS